MFLIVIILNGVKKDLKAVFIYNSVISESVDHFTIFWGPFLLHSMRSACSFYEPIYYILLYIVSMLMGKLEIPSWFSHDTRETVVSLLTS